MPIPILSPLPRPDEPPPASAGGGWSVRCEPDPVPVPVPVPVSVPDLVVVVWRPVSVGLEVPEAGGASPAPRGVVVKTRVGQSDAQNSTHRNARGAGGAASYPLHRPAMCGTTCCPCGVPLARPRQRRKGTASGRRSCRQSFVAASPRSRYIRGPVPSCEPISAGVSRGCRRGSYHLLVWVRSRVPLTSMMVSMMVLDWHDRPNQQSPLPQQPILDPMVVSPPELQ